jgi:uncharacterized protein
MRIASRSSLSRALLAELRRGFALDFMGIHGVRHWGRVRRNGLLLAAESGADTVVVELFAVFHDACRWSDGHDPEHGHRGAELAAQLCGELFELDDRRLELLQTACRGHSDGWTDGEPTVVTCWDADRLDLGRVGITPDPRYLCTPAARRPEILDWCYRQSLR